MAVLRNSVQLFARTNAAVWHPKDQSIRQLFPIHPSVGICLFLPLAAVISSLCHKDLLLLSSLRNTEKAGPGGGGVGESPDVSVTGRAALRA